MIPEKNLRVFGTVFFLLACCFVLKAQTISAEEIVYSFFSKPKKVKWIEHYHGKIDGANKISIVLAFDGKSCKGLLTYPTSGDRLRLDGELDGNELQLLEVDQNGAVTGAFEGYMEGQNLFLSWSNFDNTLGNELFLTQKKDASKLFALESDDSWINSYEGTIGKSYVTFYIQKHGSNSLTGIAFFEAENKSYNFCGDVFDFDNVNIVIKDDKNRIKGKLEGVFEKGKHISANYYSKSGERYPIFLQAKEHLKTGCKEYADYVACFDISFPKTKSTSFNHWMDNEADQWMNKCRQQNYEIKKANNNTKKPETRSSIRANGWSDVDYFDEKIIRNGL